MVAGDESQTGYPEWGLKSPSTTTSKL